MNDELLVLIHFIFELSKLELRKERKSWNFHLWLLHLWMLQLQNADNMLKQDRLLNPTQNIKF